MPSLYPHEVRKIAQGAGAASGFAGFFFPSLRARGLGEEKPVPPYSAIVYKDGDEVRAEDWKGRKIASGEAGVDDADVIQSASDSLPDKGKLFISRGTYNITHIKLLKNIYIESDFAILKATSASEIVKNWANAPLEVVIKRLVFDGNKVATRLLQAGPDGFVNSLIEGCIFKNAPSDQMMVQGYFSNSIIRGCYFMRDASSGLDAIGYDADGFIITNCFFYNAFAGTGGARRVTITNNIFYNTQAGQTAVLIEAKSKDNYIVEVSNNIFYNAVLGFNSGGQEVTGSVTDFVFSNNIFYYGNIEINPETLGAYKNIVIKNNIIRNSPKSGIYAYGIEDTIIEGNLIENTNMKDDSFYYNKGGIVCNQVYGRYIVRNNIIKRTETATTYGTPHGISVDKGEGIVIIENNAVRSTAYDAIHTYNTPTGGVVIRRNQGYATENSGNAAFSGDGTTTQFSIAHGLVSEPSKALVTPMTEDAAGDFYVTKDATNIYVNYLSAPPSGSNNVKLSWYAEV